MVVPMQKFKISVFFENNFQSNLPLRDFLKSLKTHFSPALFKAKMYFLKEKNLETSNLGIEMVPKIIFLFCDFIDLPLKTNCIFPKKYGKQQNPTFFQELTSSGGAKKSRVFIFSKKYVFGVCTG